MIQSYSNCLSSFQVSPFDAIINHYLIRHTINQLAYLSSSLPSPSTWDTPTQRDNGCMPRPQPIHGRVGDCARQCQTCRGSTFLEPGWRTPMLRAHKMHPSTSHTQWCGVLQAAAKTKLAYARLAGFRTNPSRKTKQLVHFETPVAGMQGQGRIE